MSASAASPVLRGIFVETYFAALFIVLWVFAGPTIRYVRQKQLKMLLIEIERKNQEVATLVQKWFMVQPCFRCHEFTMQLVGISPNGRSAECQCLHCKKKMHAPASNENAAGIMSSWGDLQELTEKYRSKSGSSPHAKQSLQESAAVRFAVPAAPLPFEQISRTPIPEAIRSEVWRRDSGQCVQCGTKQNLQYDHIIPISRGGANTVSNLQLLCQSCNCRKGAKV